MANPLTSLLAIPFQPAADAAVQVVDSFSTRTVTVQSAYWYRHLLAPSVATGGADTPKEFLRYFAALLNAAPGAAYWSVALQTDGYPRITYNGGAGAAAINWTSSVPRNLLGFTSNLTFAAPGSSATAPYQPTHVILVSGRADDSDWSPEFEGYAHTETGRGYVDALDDGYALVRRGFRLTALPRTWADRATFGTLSTPAWPDELAASRWTQPGSAVAAGIAPPWSVHQALHASRAKLCAFALGSLQPVIGGGTTLYEVGYVAPGTWDRDGGFRRTTKGLRGLVERPGVTLTLTNREDVT